MTGILLLDKYNFNDYITTRYPDNYKYEGAKFRVRWYEKDTILSACNIELKINISSN